MAELIIIVCRCLEQLLSGNLVSTVWYKGTAVALFAAQENSTGSHFLKDRRLLEKWQCSLAKIANHHLGKFRKAYDFCRSEIVQ